MIEKDIMAYVLLLLMFFLWRNMSEETSKAEQKVAHFLSALVVIPLWVIFTISILLHLVQTVWFLPLLFSWAITRINKI